MDLVKTKKLEDNEDYDAIIVFTDGWGEVDPEVEPDIPVLWICSEKSPYSEALPFGKVVYMNGWGEVDVV